MKRGVTQLLCMVRLATSVMGAIVVVALSLCHVPHAMGQSAAEFYKGKTVRIVVGFGVGGGFDLYARMLAPHLGKALQATVIVENQPGAGSMLAVNRLYRSPPDGLLVMMAHGGANTLQQLLRLQGVAYDLTKVGHLGVINASVSLWLGQPGKSAIMTPADAMKPGVTVNWGTSGEIDGSSDGGAIICNALKLSCKIIPGYKGMADAALAIERREMDSMHVMDESAMVYVRSGQTRPIATMARDRSSLFPDVPTIFESVKLNAEQEWWFDFRAALGALGRVMLAPPGVPADRLKFLQDAVAKMVQDPQLLAEAKKMKFYVNYRDPKVAQAAIDRVLNAPTPAQRAEIENVILRKYTTR